MVASVWLKVKLFFFVMLFLKLVMITASVVMRTEQSKDQVFQEGGEIISVEIAVGRCRVMVHQGRFWG